MSKQVDLDETQDELFSQFEQIITQINAVKSQLSSIQNNIKVLEKGAKKHMKNIKKNASKMKTKTARAPSGFAKPCKVTKELCEFMNKSEGTEFARTEVTRALVSYIKENNLQNAENNRVISPDKKLKSLLGVGDGEELNYFNIQKYMNKHFVKNVAVK